MSKGRRSQGPQKVAPSRTTSTEQAVEAGVGNAAQAEELDGRHIPVDAAGDAAKPVVEHARLALEVRYEGQTPMARLIALLEASDLPTDSSSWLAERLKSTRATEALVAKAVTTWFGEDGAERAEQALAGVASVLAAGQATEMGWVSAAGAVPIAQGQTIREAVDHLLLGLGAEDGPAIVGFCRQLHLAVMFDDDEDEELDWGLPGL